MYFENCNYEKGMKTKLTLNIVLIYYKQILVEQSLLLLL